MTACGIAIIPELHSPFYFREVFLFAFFFVNKIAALSAKEPGVRAKTELTVTSPDLSAN